MKAFVLCGVQRLAPKFSPRQLWKSDYSHVFEEVDTSSMATSDLSADQGHRNHQGQSQGRHVHALSGRHAHALSGRGFDQGQGRSRSRSFWSSGYESDSKFWISVREDEMSDVSSCVSAPLPCLGCMQAAAHHFDDGWNTGSQMQSIESLPVLEMMERQMDEGSDGRKMYQAYKGQLKISAYINYGLLTVHVMQGRHFTSRYQHTCESYIKISLVPDESRRTKCKTEVCRDTNHPVFDEKFSFELLESDSDRRLLVTAWNKHKGRSEFLGCMSFGIHHLQRSAKVIDGWYYLLTEDIGRRKHLQVGGKGTRRKPAKVKVNPEVPAVSKDLMWMDSHTFLIKRGSNGYGFSVTGGCPAQVCRVEFGSPGYKCGLQKYDCIIRINGQNVSRSSCDSVARVVRHCPKKIILEVQRPRPLGLGRSSPCQLSLANSTFHSNTSTDTTSSADDSPPLTIDDLRESIRHDSYEMHEHSLEKIVRDLERDTVWAEGEDPDYDDPYGDLDGLLASHVLHKPRGLQRHGSLNSINVKEEWESFRKRHKQLQREKSFSKPDLQSDKKYEDYEEDVDDFSAEHQCNKQYTQESCDTKTLPRNFFSSRGLKKVTKPSQEVPSALERISEVIDDEDSFCGNNSSGKSRSIYSGKSRSTLSHEFSGDSYGSGNSRHSSDVPLEQIKAELEQLPRRDNSRMDRSWLDECDERNDMSVDSIFDGSDSDEMFVQKWKIPAPVECKLEVKDAPTIQHAVDVHASYNGTTQFPNIHRDHPSNTYLPSNTDAGQHRPQQMHKTQAAHTQNKYCNNYQSSHNKYCNQSQSRKYEFGGKENYQPYAINKTAALPSSGHIGSFKPHIELMNPSSARDHAFRLNTQLGNRPFRPFQDIATNIFV